MSTLAIWSRIAQSRDVQFRVFSRPVLARNYLKLLRRDVLTYSYIGLALRQGGNQGRVQLRNLRRRLEG